MLQDISSTLSHSSTLITEAVIVKGFGVRSSKDFLKPGYTGADTTIRRGHNSYKRRCLSIYLSGTRQQIIDGMWLNMFYTTRQIIVYTILPLLVTTMEKEKEQEEGGGSWEEWQAGTYTH